MQSFTMITTNLDSAANAIEVLTKEMDAIFAQYPQCEAPEFMPEDARKNWHELYMIRRNLFNKIESVRRAAAELGRFVTMDATI